ncbi:MAG: hypothetical protein IKN17_03805 [Ruminococcus sp.]|nr:hypothetical protein [Ruminococcus sp.]
MSKFERPDPSAASALLKLVSAKLGTDPQSLEQQLKNGGAAQLAKSLPPDQAGKLREALSDPASTRKILQSPQARAVMDKLRKK